MSAIRAMDGAENVKAWVVAFVGGPLDGEMRVMQTPLPSIHSVRRLFRADARYRFDGDRTYRFMGEE